jgi:hypothetical protein
VPVVSAHKVEEEEEKEEEDGGSKEYVLWTPPQPRPTPECTTPPAQCFIIY